MKTYRLEILTPLGKSFSGEVTHTLLPAEDGFVGVLARHASYVTSSPGGRLEVRLSSGQTRSFRVGRGFFHFLADAAVFLTQTVETQHA